MTGIIVAAVLANAIMPKVKTGLEVLRDQGFQELAGKRVGLVTNPTGIDHSFNANIDVLRKGGVNVTALFGPEHGVRGTAGAGELVEDAVDAETGIPEYSLYGKNRRPSSAMLKNVDVLVFDIQDIGSRSYTYIWTMGSCMQSAAEAGIPFMVLDRPNPLGGERVEGNLVEKGYVSAVSPYPIPYVHGLTVGELARYLNGEGLVPGGKKCDLRVVKLEGWKRADTWFDTGLPWVSTSPHIPKPESAFFYAATGIVGELDGLSIGVGMPTPFELAGAPGVSSARFAAELNSRGFPGVTFRACSFAPYYALYKGQTCGGVQIHITDYRTAPLTRLNFELMDAARKLGAPIEFFPGGKPKLFDKVCGTDSVRKDFLAGRSSAEIWEKWDAASEGFKKARAPYLLYP